MLSYTTVKATKQVGIPLKNKQKGDKERLDKVGRSQKIFTNLEVRIAWE